MNNDVSVILPVKAEDDWQIELAEFAINSMRSRTRKKFELVVVEYEARNLKDICDLHIERLPSTYTEDRNEGQDQASGDIIIHTSIDVIVGDAWIESLLEPFELFEDCGITTTSMTGTGGDIGESVASRKIIEGMNGKFMMFRKPWKMDNAFPNLHSDSDLIMRMYQDGLRAYRNYRSVAYSVEGIDAGVNGSSSRRRSEQRKQAEMLFRTRYAASPLWISKMILNGVIRHGQEHE
jgi:glycosyltransferase involved in cell wall biosynthesis